MRKDFTKIRMLKALNRLDELLTQPIELIVGGGAAMVCVYDFPLHTYDIDAVLKKTSLDEIKPLVHKVATEMGLPKDWLNTWYSTFTHNLPEDFNTRLQPFFKGRHILAQALGPEDILILKCCAHRKKDLGHVRFLIRKKTDYEFVINHLENLRGKKIIPNDDVIEFLEKALDLEGK